MPTRCSVCSNGYAFARRRFTAQFLKYQPFGIKLSFHSYHREIFEDITQVKGSYEAVLKAIDTIQTVLKVYPKTEYSYLITNIVITRYNYKDLPKIIDFLYRRGIRVVKLSYLELEGRVYTNTNALIEVT